MPSQNRGSSSNQRSASTRGSTSGGWQTSLSQRLASTGLSTTTQSSSSSQLSSSTPQPSSSRTSANQASSAINTQQHTAAGSVSQRGSTSDDDGDSNSSTPPEDEVTDDEVTYQLVCWNSAADVLVESYTASQPDSTGETTQDLEVVGQLSDRVRGRTSRMRFRTNEELRAYIRDEINQPSLAPWVPTREEMQARIARAL